MTPTHSSVIRIVPGSRTAVLFLHGILGTPNHFQFLFDSVPSHWTFCSLLLDGHGKSVRDFSRTSMKKWEQQVALAANELLRTHTNLILVGHSMGTLLAADVALAHPEQVKALFFLDTPLKIRLSFSVIRNSFRYVFDRFPENDPTAQAVKAACSIAPDLHLWRYLGWIPRYLELFRKIRQTRRILPKLTPPIFIFQSHLDELVSRNAVRFIPDHSGIHFSLLMHSGHFAYSPDDQELVRTAFQQLCKAETDSELSQSTD